MFGSGERLFSWFPQFPGGYALPVSPTLFRLSSYASLPAAITAIGSTPNAQLLVDVPGSAPVGTTTVPINIQLANVAGKFISVPASAVLKVLGLIVTPSGQQLFNVTGSGLVDLHTSVGQVADVSWFGANGQGAGTNGFPVNADDGIFINQAIASRAYYVVGHGAYNIQTTIDFTPWGTGNEGPTDIGHYFDFGATRLYLNANLTSMVSISASDNTQLFRHRWRFGRIYGNNITFTCTQLVYIRQTSNSFLEFLTIENGSNDGLVVDQSGTPAFISGNNHIRCERIGGHGRHGINTLALTTGVLGVEGWVWNIDESGFNGGDGIRIGNAVNQRVQTGVWNIGTCDGNTGTGLNIFGGGNTIIVGSTVGNGVGIDCPLGITTPNTVIGVASDTVSLNFLSSQRYILNQTVGTLGVNLGRRILQAAITIFVSTTGNDSNNGLSAGTAFLTINKAIAYLATLDLNGFTATIQLADGTYTGRATFNLAIIGGSVILNGNSITPSNVIISTTSQDAVFVTCNIPASLTVQNLQVQTATSGSGINHQGVGSIIWKNVVFGACVNSHIQAAANGAQCICAGAYSITGNANNHYNAIHGGFIQQDFQTITLTGTPAFALQFAHSATCSEIESTGSTFSGAATGTRYLAEINGVINTFGGGANYFPGNAAGSVANGGQYV